MEPLVEGADGDLREQGVVQQSLLDQTGQRREHQRGVDALRIQELQTGSGLPERRNGSHRLPGELAE